MANDPLDKTSSLNENCGVFGVWQVPHASDLTYLGLHALQHRGQEGAGIVSLDADGLKKESGLGLLNQVFAQPEKLNHLSGNSAIGHVRYATAGKNDECNIQPFILRKKGRAIALAHNGNLTNAKTLRKKLENSGIKFQSSTDSEILLHLIARSQARSFRDRLTEALNQVHGGFAFLVLTDGALYAALDPHGFRPLVVGQLSNHSYVVASETAALNAVNAEFVCDVDPGELIQIDDAGLTKMTYTDRTHLDVDAMEFIYFARPDSTIRGVSVHQARKKMGEILAQESPADADIVVGVPNSSSSAVLGFAEVAQKPVEMGLIKNQYIARTFIEPTQSKREQAVKMKLSTVTSVVKDKRVILIDDSIVRGTTTRYIVRMLKEAGAKEVHVRIASPAFKFPSFYGVDVQTRNELLAAHYSTAEMSELIGADSLSFLSLDGLVAAVGLKNKTGSGLLTAYFDGVYPEQIYDYSSELTSEKKRHLVSFREVIDV